MHGDELDPCPAYEIAVKAGVAGMSAVVSELRRARDLEPTYYGAARRMASPSSRRVKKSWSSTEMSDNPFPVSKKGGEVGLRTHRQSSRCLWGQQARSAGAKART